jgi:hypothetical protein
MLLQVIAPFPNMKHNLICINNYQYYQCNLFHNKHIHLCIFINNTLVPIKTMALVNDPFGMQQAHNVLINSLDMVNKSFKRLLPIMFILESWLW